MTGWRPSGEVEEIAHRPSGFWFLVSHVATQLAIQWQQERIQVARSNKVARKRLTESNDSWSLSHLGYLYSGTTPVMIKRD